ncbi:hypothetical protein QJ856_gp0756 [Tupanvirus deep ocean]|uniref:Uncharacterized protein n=2 Tax=Tupanvirus TaxID=2094720 RepID=A0AC62A8A0_9VIRU|nr:hypothetical protein QJ856_gp0756 [Tupanvirus deep ocean]QKU33996.1 hypothetical protein [Tupanvirus deep ocean]
MEFLSDFARTNNLLNTDEMTSVEFSEYYGPSRANNQQNGESFQSGKNNFDTLGSAEENHQRYTSNNDRKDSQYDEQDSYAKKQERGNRRAESLSDERNWNYNVDIMDNEGSKRHRGLDTDFRWQTGGKGDNLNYLDDYTSAQYNSKRLDSYVKEFFAIYNKAREFRQRIMDIEKQKGGQEENKPKKPVNKTLALMLELSKNMKDSGKYPNIQQKHFMKISKMIVDEAKKQTGMQEVNDTVRQTALQLVKNADPFVTKFRNEQSQNQGNQGSEGNTRTRSGNYRNSNNNTNGNNSRRKFNGDTDDNVMGSNFTNLTDTFSDNKNNFGNNNKTNQNTLWKGSNSNYSNYAQSNLWRDVPEWRDNSQSNFSETQRFSGDAQDYLNSSTDSKYYSQNNKESGNDHTLNRYGNATTSANINAVPGNRTGATNDNYRGTSFGNDRNDRNDRKRANTGNNGNESDYNRRSNTSDRNNRDGPKRDSRNMLENDRRQNTYGTSGELSQNATSGMSMDRVRMIY